MLRNILNLYKVEKIGRHFLPSQRYSAYSLSYQQSQTSPRIGIVWTEESNMTAFCNIMKACQKVDHNHLCDRLYLIRKERLGTASNKGYQLYIKVFKNSSHHHINPDIASLHYLVTYTKLLNSVNSGELIIAGKTPTIEEFQTLVRQENVLGNCSLLQELGITQTSEKVENSKSDSDLQSVQDFMMNMMITQQVLARLTLINVTVLEYPKVEVDKINQIIDKLSNQNKIKILNPLDSYSRQTICLQV